MSAHYCIGNPCRICHPEFYPEPQPFKLPPAMTVKEAVDKVIEAMESDPEGVARAWREVGGKYADRPGKKIRTLLRRMRKHFARGGEERAETPK